MARREYRTKKSGRKFVVIILVVLVILIVALFIKYKNKVSAKNLLIGDVLQTANLNSPSPKATASTTTPITLARARDNDGLFEVYFPKNVFKKTDRDEASPPDFVSKINSLALVYSAVPTANIFISFIVVKKTFSEIYASLAKAYDLKNLQIVSIDGHQGVSFITGERVVYSVVPVDDSKTLFIARHYFGGQSATKNPDSKNPIGFEEQKKLFDGIMATFSFKYSI